MDLSLQSFVRPAAFGGPAFPCSTAILANVADWNRCEGQWRTLFLASPTAAPTLDWDWLRTWWDIYGQTYALGHDALKVLVVRRGGRLIGALPLYLSAPPVPFGPRRLRFLSTGEAEFEETCAEYLDLLHLPGESDDCLEALSTTLQSLGWDELDLGPMPASSPLLDWARRPAGDFEVRTESANPIADLAGGFEAYLHLLSANTRQQARRLIRAADRAGAALELAGDERSIDEAFEQLSRLHQQRWTSAGQPGCFAAPRFSAFHQALLQRWLPSGKAILASLSMAGRTCAVLYGFNVRGKFDFYQSGVSIDDCGPLRSPGISAHLLLMRELAERGIPRYDFLSGASPYKERLATDRCPQVRLRGRRRTLRAASGRLADSCQRAVRAGRKLLRTGLRPLRNRLPDDGDRS